MEETKGTGELKEMMLFLFSLAGAIDKAQADGKIDAADFMLLADPLMKAIPAFSGAGQLAGEWKDLDDAEQEDLRSFVKANFDIADDDLEAKVELALDVALRLGRFFG